MEGGRRIHPSRKGNWSLFSRLERTQSKPKPALLPRFAPHHTILSIDSIFILRTHASIYLHPAVTGRYSPARLCCRVGAEDIETRERKEQTQIRLFTFICHRHTIVENMWSKHFMIDQIHPSRFFQTICKTREWRPNPTFLLQDHRHDNNRDTFCESPRPTLSPAPHSSSRSSSFLWRRTERPRQLTVPTKERGSRNRCAPPSAPEALTYLSSAFFLDEKLERGSALPGAARPWLTDPAARHLPIDSVQAEKPENTEEGSASSEGYPKDRSPGHPVFFALPRNSPLTAEHYSFLKKR